VLHRRQTLRALLTTSERGSSVASLRFDKKKRKRVRYVWKNLRKTSNAFRINRSIANARLSRPAFREINRARNSRDQLINASIKYSSLSLPLHAANKLPADSSRSLRSRRVARSRPACRDNYAHEIERPGVLISHRLSKAFSTSALAPSREEMLPDLSLSLFLSFALRALSLLSRSFSRAERAPRQ